MNFVCVIVIVSFGFFNNTVSVIMSTRLMLVTLKPDPVLILKVAFHNFFSALINQKKR